MNAYEYIAMCVFPVSSWAFACRWCGDVMGDEFQVEHKGFLYFVAVTLALTIGAISAAVWPLTIAIAFVAMIVPHPSERLRSRR